MTTRIGIGPEKAGQGHPHNQQAEAHTSVLMDVALVDGPQAAAVGGMSLSWWHEKVRKGEAPQPVVRAPRCTRWRLADVRSFWVEFASTAANSPAAAGVLDTATRASAAALAKRRAQKSGGL